MRGSMAMAACLAAIGFLTVPTVSTLGADAAPVPAAAPAQDQDTAGPPAEAMPSDAALAAISTYESEVQTASAQLPKNLEAPGTDFYVAHAEAIASLDATAAKALARRMADVLVAHKIKISDALAKLPEITADSANQPPISHADVIRLSAIVDHFVDVEQYPFQETQQALPYNNLFNSLLETVALYAPSADARYKASVRLSDTESILSVGIVPDENLTDTWVDPARVAKAWDSTFAYMLDPNTTDAKGKLDPAFGSLFQEFNNEIYALFMISHELSAQTAGPEALSVPLQNLIDTAKKAQADVNNPVDTELLTLFIAHIENLKKEGAGARAAAYAARPAATKLITDFIAAVNTGDHDALAKVLTPAALKAAVTPADLPAALFDKNPVKDVKVFFVAAPNLDTAGTGGDKRRLVFYLEATDAKDGHTRHIRQEASLVKTGDAWLINGVNGVFAAE